MYAALSIRHSKSRSSGALWLSVPVNSKTIEPLLTFVISATAAWSSTTVQVWPSVRELFAASVARTSNVCSAAERSEYDVGDVQAANGWLSMRHSIVTAPGQLSVALKVKS